MRIFDIYCLHQVFYSIPRILKEPDEDNVENSHKNLKLLIVKIVTFVPNYRVKTVSLTVFAFSVILTFKNSTWAEPRRPKLRSPNRSKRCFWLGRIWKNWRRNLPRSWRSHPRVPRQCSSLGSLYATCLIYKLFNFSLNSPYLRCFEI